MCSNIGRSLIKSSTLELNGVPVQHNYYCKECGNMCSIDSDEAYFVKPEDKDYLCKFCYGIKNNDPYYLFIKEFKNQKNTQ
jgi:hypothetical protein